MWCLWHFVHAFCSLWRKTFTNRDLQNRVPNNMHGLMKNCVRAKKPNSDFYFYIIIVLPIPGLSHFMILCYFLSSLGSRDLTTMHFWWSLVRNQNKWTGSEPALNQAMTFSPLSCSIFNNEYWIFNFHLVIKRYPIII